jgi:hypothetical protein
MKRSWCYKAVEYLDTIYDPVSGGSRSVPGGNVTLYGTCYAALGRDYILGNVSLSEGTRDFLIKFQDSDSGLMIGPEMSHVFPAAGAVHDRQHQILHLTCAAIATCQHFDLPIKYAIRAAHLFCNLDYLMAWLRQRNFRRAWLEGNNILFIGQLLVYLRDVEAIPTAQAALDLWFQWLDDNVDPETNLWGTNGYCSTTEAVYGGYHQLLVYYHENHSIVNPRGLVDTVLQLQHRDGGFSPYGNAGACEDVDCVDILVNLYKRFDYRRAHIRYSICRCVDHILKTQNHDGGFPYNRNIAQSIMGIPDTQAPENVSTTFATWFRIHTLALCAEIIPNHPAFMGVKFRFSKTLSMGWHASPNSWQLKVGSAQIIKETLMPLRTGFPQLRHAGRQLGKKVLCRLGLR